MGIELLKKANKGDVDAQIALGMNYEAGLGVKQDLEIAFGWFKRAADAGSAFAMHRLAENCERGIFPGGASAAKAWRQKADEKGGADLADVLAKLNNSKAIPAYRDPKKRQAAAQSVVPLNKKVLIVDDEEAVRDLLDVMLSQLGYKVVQAESVKRALSQMAAHPDLKAVLLDYSMPQVNGLQLLGMAKKMRLLEQVPFIMVSAQRDKELITRARALGVSGWILKPFDRDKVSAALKSLVA